MVLKETYFHFYFKEIESEMGWVILWPVVGLHFTLSFFVDC